MIYEHMEDLCSWSTAIFVLPIKRGLKRFIPVLQCLHDVYVRTQLNSFMLQKNACRKASKDSILLGI